MNRGAQAMNAFLYSMKLRGLKHGSEEEYDLFEDIAVCRARNRRSNGAAESKLQLEHVGEDHATTTHAERGGDPSCAAEQEDEPKRCDEDGKQGADHEGDRMRTQSGEEHHQAPHPSTPVKDTTVLQIMIRGVQQQETKCSKPNNPPPQAKPNTRE